MNVSYVWLFSVSMASLDTYLSAAQTTDTRKRFTAHPEIVNHLLDPSSSLQCENLEGFVDGITSWVNSSNFKVCTVAYIKKNSVCLFLELIPYIMLH